VARELFDFAGPRSLVNFTIPSTDTYQILTTALFG
jgi:hypothetical protein